MRNAEPQRMAFALKRLGIKTSDELEAYLHRPEKPLPPDEIERRRAEVHESLPHLRPNEETGAMSLAVEL